MALSRAAQAIKEPQRTIAIILAKLSQSLARSDEREEKPFFLAERPELAKYDIGECTYGDPIVRSWGEGAALKIGRYCSIASNVTIMLGGEHRTDWVTTYPFSALFAEAETYQGHPRTKGDVVIGNDVWIGDGALILSGICVGDGAVIAARAVVTKNVAPYAIVAGNPARVVRFRFPQHVVRSLRRIAWWDWPLHQVKEAWPSLLNDDIDAFVKQYDPACDSEREGELESKAEATRGQGEHATSSDTPPTISVPVSEPRRQT